MKSRDECKKHALTPGQIRAARGLLDWSREKLSERSGVSMRTLAQIESAEDNARIETIEAIRSAFDGAGIKFVKENGGGSGVRLKRRSHR